MESNYDLTKGEVINLGFNWFFKMIYYTFSFAGVMLYLAKDPNGYRWVWFVGTFIWLFAAGISFKCTSTGYSRGLNFYFFKFYLNECIRWDKNPSLDIYNLWFTYGMSWNRSFLLLLRFTLSNFDEVTELISRNTRIDELKRQYFIDYVNMRKRQGIFKRIMRSVFVIAVILLILYVVTLNAIRRRDNAVWVVGTENIIRHQNVRID